MFRTIFLNLKNRVCLVVGGGEVATQKVKSLIESEATVSVIAPEVTSEIDRLAKTNIISLEKREFIAGDSEGSFLVFAATDSHKMNAEIASEARHENGTIFVNAVDQLSECTFAATATFRRDDRLVSISTNGKSPAIARKIREILEFQFDRESEQNFGKITPLFPIGLLESEKLEKIDSEIFVIPHTITDRSLQFGILTADQICHDHLEKFIRENFIDKKYADRVEFLGLLRPTVLSSIETPEKRKQFFDRIIENQELWYFLEKSK